MEATTQEKNEQDFQDLFVEAAGKSEAPAVVETVQSPEEEAVVAAEKVKAEKVAAEKEAAEKEAAEKAAAEPDYKKLYEEEKAARETAAQKMNSWEGRLSASEAKNKELVSKLNEALTGKLAPATPKVEGPAPEDEDEKLVVAFQKEMGEEFTKPMSVIIRRAVNTETKALQEELKATKEKLAGYDDIYIAQHYERIEEKHPDIESLIAPLNEWIKTLPLEKGQIAQNVMNRGNARQVIQLVNNYKIAHKIPIAGETNVVAPKVVAAPVDPKKVAAATAVVDRGPSVIPKTEKDKDDFEGTFKDITEDKK